MQYSSTRGYGSVSFKQALLDGLAPDSGLYLPEAYPQFDAEKISAFSNMSFQQIAVEIMEPFMAPDFTRDQIEVLVNKAYQSFHHDEITPIKKLDDGFFMLELFHGPTLAFKDVALQMLGQLFANILEEKKQSATVLGATSGDTGPAALEGVAGLSVVQAFILFPHGRVSDVQRRQMTTLKQPNIFPIALEGTFDDCQNIVKDLFADATFKSKVQATAINSISWARLLPQVVYYFYAASRIQEGQPLNFVVPTGNFGDIFAGFVAQRCGLEMGKLVVASNQNDILTRFVNANDYSQKAVHATVSPSIDIQIASNFERFLFELFGRDTNRLCQTMTNFKKTGALQVSENEFKQVQKIFSATAVSEEETIEAIAGAHQKYGELIDTHTAVAFKAAEVFAEKPSVVLATAHAAKFPDAVEKAVGSRPPLPSHLSDLMERDEVFKVLPNDIEAVKQYILEHTQ